MGRRTLAEALGDMILALPHVELRPSRFGEGAAFWVGHREVAHFHPGNELDVRLTRPCVRALRDELADDPRVSARPGSDWVAFRFRRRVDLPRALDLVRQACEANR